MPQNDAKTRAKGHELKISRDKMAKSWKNESEGA